MPHHMAALRKLNPALQQRMPKPAHRAVAALAQARPTAADTITSSRSNRPLNQAAGQEAAEHQLLRRLL
jgi:hypothetical protein